MKKSFLGFTVLMVARVITFGALIWALVILVNQAVYGETAVCAEKNADALRICASLRVESEIASGNEAAAHARKALYALRDGKDPEIFVPLLAGWLLDADLTLAEFGVTKSGVAAVVNRYYVAKKRALNIYAMAEQGETEKAFREIRLIYEKEHAVLAIVKTNFAPYPIRLITSSPTR